LVSVVGHHARLLPACICLEILIGWFYGAKAKMICAGISFALAARADDVARAVLFVAEELAV
jgi:hypothetical protein